MDVVESSVRAAQDQQGTWLASLLNYPRPSEAPGPKFCSSTELSEAQAGSKGQESRMIFGEPAMGSSDRRVADFGSAIDDLAAKLYQETHYYGNPAFVTASSIFGRIEGLAKFAPSAVYPVLLSRLHDEAGVWLIALPRLVGESPVRIEHRGRVRLMIDDWLEWGRKQGYVT